MHQQGDANAQQKQKTVILGATGSIGAATASLLHEQGHALMLGARSQEALKALRHKLPGAHVQVVDATDSAQVDAFVQAGKDAMGGVDGLVNCVGSFALAPLHKVRDEDFARDLALNLHSAFFALRAAVRAMDPKRGGSAVLLSSAAARFGIPSHESIAAAKAGIVGLVLSAAATYAQSHIRVNAVAPGLVPSALTRQITEHEVVAKASASMHPLHKFGDAAQVARTIAFLLARDNDFITGQVWGVDGGLASVASKR